MKGKNKYTSNEISQIEKLIEEKLKAPSEKQKGVRNKIRNIGFYWEDFHPKGDVPKIEYNIENFRKLINNGIIITDTTNKYINTIKTNTSNKCDKQTEHFKNGLEPWVGNNPKVLILGTMPGDISIKQKTYYANPSNKFWEIMYSLFPKEEGQDNKEFITSNGIALWDCVKSGIRIGSMDKEFDDNTIIPNNLNSFLQQYPTIKTIILNGKTKTAEYYYKFFCDIEGYNIRILNSTASYISINEKKEEWSIIKDLVKDE